MSGGRKQIVGMVAAGQITPWEGERLLMALNEERESRWVFGACAVPALVSFLHGVWLHMAATGALHTAAAVVNAVFGGVR